MPMVLQEMMRQASVQTTEQYYVGIKARKTARFQQEMPPTKKGLSEKLKPWKNR